jgi:hypothetical protein
MRGMRHNNSNSHSLTGINHITSEPSPVDLTPKAFIFYLFSLKFMFVGCFFRRENVVSLLKMLNVEDTQEDEFTTSPRRDRAAKGRAILIPMVAAILLRSFA